MNSGSEPALSDHGLEFSDALVDRAPMRPDRALVLLPDAADPEGPPRALAAAGLDVVRLDSVDALLEAIDDDAELALVAADGLADGDLGRLAEAVRGEPSGADLPLILLADPADPPGPPDLLAALSSSTVIEAPADPLALRVAIRGAQHVRAQQRRLRAYRAALSASAATLRFTLDAGRLGAWEYSPDRDRVDGSRQFKLIVGQPADAPLPCARLLASVHPDDREQVRAAARESLRGGARMELECRVRWADGSFRHIEVRGRVLELEGGRRTLAGVALDVTERARSRDELAARVAARTAELEAAMAQRALAEAALRQSQKMEAVGQLTGGVAHDFNNLLQVISGGLQLLERGGSPERRHRLLEAMRQATERGAQLTRQLLAFARRQELRPELLDLGQHLASMRDLLQRSLRGDIRISLAMAPDLWPVEVDPIQLELAILNLAVNARDAMPGGGVVLISARNVAGWRDGALAGDFVRLAVEDTGVGMPPDVQARAFEPFFTTKEVGSGSGLGLPQVYGFAVQSRGTVRIDSVPGEGTTVALMLPRASAPASRASASPAAAPRRAGDAEAELPPAAPGTTVLLVEDDDRVAELAAEMLLQLGYGYTRVRTGHAALSVLASGQRVDVVFSDVLMPGGMNGAELAEEVRRRRPGLPIVLATGFDGEAIAQARAEDLPLLRKPYRLDTLAQTLRHAHQHGGARNGVAHA
jgi:PAS domain S-box-containing protein